MFDYKFVPRQMSRYKFYDGGMTGPLSEMMIWSFSGSAKCFPRDESREICKGLCPATGQ